MEPSVTTRAHHRTIRSAPTVFSSSCFVGVRKPDEAIYRLALSVIQRRPEACLFIDDW